MSEQVISQKVQRICDGCGKEHTYELIGAEQDQIIEMATWYVIEHKVTDYAAGQFIQMKVQACSLACVPTAATKIAILPADNGENDRPIDPNSLRAN
jgi:hypothetical protein